MKPPPPTIADQLLEDPHRFGFFQAVRLLELLHQDRTPVGRTGPARDEILRFRAHVDLVFPPSEIAALAPVAPDERTPADEQRPAYELTQAFFGLVGPLGVLPYPYTELVQSRRRAGDRTVGAFLDLFHHRLLSLFFRAWEKYRPALLTERGEPDRFADRLLAFLGLGLESVQHRHDFPDHAFLFHASSLAQRHRNPVMLARMLGERTGLPVSVVSFRGRWLAIERADQSRVGVPRGFATLGADLVVGRRVWDEQGMFRLRVGPLSLDQFLSLDPEGPAFRRLTQLTRFYVDAEFDFDVQLVLRAEDVPACQLGAGSFPRLGRTTWLLSQPAHSDAPDAVFPES